MNSSLRHQSDSGGRRRHAMSNAASLRYPHAALQGAGVLTPERECGFGPLRRQLRGRGGAASSMNFGASAGALRREIDDVVDCQVDRLSRGHLTDPFGVDVSVADQPSDRRIARAEIIFEFGASHE